MVPKKAASQTFYITTAIDYSNSVPHLGHALEKIGADVIARFERFLGKEVFFLVGTDEHSQNVKRMAEKEGKNPKTYCDEMAEKFQTAWQILNISFDRFIQTTEPLHKEVVSEIITRIYQKGDVYKGFYEGDYCPSCESFLDNSQITSDKLCTIHHIPVEHIKEENYFFRLKKYQDPLMSHIKKHPEFIQPEARRNEILGLLTQGLEDISISRPVTDWGIPLPFDPKSVVYVWVDALINYITGLGGLHTALYEKFWPANLHVIGKDITRFHCVIWPSLLMSADITLPEQVWGHGFVHYKGTKMSKTKGTGLNPVDLANTYGTDTLRYYLLREVPWDKDGEFSIQRLIERHNAELSNGIGNSVSRIHGMIAQYFEGQLAVSSQKTPHILQGNIQKKITQYLEQMTAWDLTSGLETCHDMIREINIAIDHHKPWTMAKDSKQRGQLESFLTECVMCILACAVCLAPFCPQKMEAVFSAFDLILSDFYSQDRLQKLFGVPKFHAKLPLQAIFPRITQEEMASSAM